MHELLAHKVLVDVIAFFPNTPIWVVALMLVVFIGLAVWFLYVSLSYLLVTSRFRHFFQLIVYSLIIIVVSDNFIIPLIFIPFMLIRFCLTIYFRSRKDLKMSPGMARFFDIYDV